MKKLLFVVFLPVFCMAQVRFEQTGAAANNLMIGTGASVVIGTVQWDAAASDSINGANIAARTITDLMLPAALTAKSAGVSDADYGDVTVSTGAWAVEDDPTFTNLNLLIEKIPED